MKIIYKIVPGRTEIATVVECKEEETDGNDRDNVEKDVMPVIKQVKVEDIERDKRAKGDVPLDKREQSGDLDSSRDSERLQIFTSNSDENSEGIRKSESLNSISTETAKPVDSPSVIQSVTVASDTDTEISAAVAMTVNTDSVTVEEVPDTAVTKKCGSSVTVLKVESGTAQFSRSHRPTSPEANFSFKIFSFKTIFFHFMLDKMFGIEGLDAVIVL